MVYEMFRDQLPDPYPDETAEWLSAINDVLENQGRQRARYLLTRILHLARQRQIGLPSLLQTDYINSIPPEQEPYFPGTSGSSCRSAASSAGTQPSWSPGPTTSTSA